MESNYSQTNAEKLKQVQTILKESVTALSPYLEFKEGVNERIPELENYCNPKRYYHNLDHVLNMLDTFESYYQKVSSSYFKYDINPYGHDVIANNIAKILNIGKIAIIFHDIVYDPTSKTNEEDSVEVLKSKFIFKDDVTWYICSSFIFETMNNPFTIYNFLKIDRDNFLFEKDDENLFSLAFVLADWDVMIDNSKTIYYVGDIAKECIDGFGIKRADYLEGRLKFIKNTLNDWNEFMFNNKELTNIYDNLKRMEDQIYMELRREYKV